MLPPSEYVGINRDDPIRFYNLPIFGSLYRKRVELCLNELNGGQRILEIGFGSGVTFFNLHDLYTEIYGLDLTAAAGEVEEFFRKRGIETHLANGNVASMPFEDNYFDAVLLISILEHLQQNDQERVFMEISRVLTPGGRVVYGVPVERPLMTMSFRLLGYDIHKHHFSSERDVYQAAARQFQLVRINGLRGFFGLTGEIYQVGCFIKA